MVAQRRPQDAPTALAKAVQEAESAVKQEVRLFEFCERELARQQNEERDGAGEGGGNQDKRKSIKHKVGAKRARAAPPIVLSRSPTRIRLRAPPLPGGPFRPPELGSEINMNPSTDPRRHSG